MSGGSSRRRFLRDLGGGAREVRSADTGRESVPPRAAKALDGSELERYARQLVLPQWSEASQLALRGSSVLVVGAGALGSPVCLYLAGAGVGRLGVVDGDAVELSNLHRQLLHFTPDLGVPKARSAAAKLGFLNPEVEVVPYEVRLDSGNAVGLLDGHDLVVDCSDSFETRYAVNAACCAERLPLVEGGVVGLAGLIMAIRPGESACYRCAFPAPPPPDSQPSCARAGVLGPAAGVVGSLQALEALKLLTDFAAPLTDAFAQVELTDLSLTTVRLTRRPDCPDCGLL